MLNCLDLRHVVDVACGAIRVPQLVLEGKGNLLEEDEDKLLVILLLCYRHVDYPVHHTKTRHSRFGDTHSC